MVTPGTVRRVAGLTTDDVERTTFEHGGKRPTVSHRGAGPAVIVMAELPGITPKVLRFAGWVADFSCTAVVPHLFGVPGRHPGRNTLSAGAYVNSSFLPACVSREFTMWATNRTSAVVGWLRSLAAAEHDQCRGPGVGADDHLLAPVLSQPSMPMPVTRGQRGGIDCSADDFAIVKHRCAAEGLQVLGLRFKGDRSVPAARFRFLQDQLDDASIAVELEDSAANPAAVMPIPHSVLTEHLVDQPGQPHTPSPRPGPRPVPRKAAHAGVTPTERSRPRTRTPSRRA